MGIYGHNITMNSVDPNSWMYQALQGMEQVGRSLNQLSEEELKQVAEQLSNLHSRAKELHQEKLTDKLYKDDDPNEPWWNK